MGGSSEDDRLGSDQESRNLSKAEVETEGSATASTELCRQDSGVVDSSCPPTRQESPADDSIDDPIEWSRTWTSQVDSELSLNQEEQVERDAQMAEQDQGEHAGPFETLASSGPQNSAGSGGHPDDCTPCTFFCFARRGCNRGAECRFCHLAHQSKLQLRREAWKQQQRQKRKAMNEAMAAEAAARRREAMRPQAMDLKRGMMRDGTGARGFRAAGMPATPIALFDRIDPGRPQTYAPPLVQAGPYNPDILSTRPHAGGPGGGSFAYSPPKGVVALGQKMDFRPQLGDLGGVPAQFRPASPLPPGLSLDPSSGILYAEPTQAIPQTIVMIEADMLGGRTRSATVEVEAIDFSRGGFHIGHLSEFEPGRFMVLLCKPDDVQDGIGLPISKGHVAGQDEITVRKKGKDGKDSVWRRLPSLPEEVVPLEKAAKGGAASTKDENTMGMVLRLAQALDDPLLGTPAMPTVGSAGHHLNKCSPCAFVYKEGCTSGAACRFCHLCERGEKRRRKKELKGFQRAMIDP